MYCEKEYILCKLFYKKNKRVFKIKSEQKLGKTQ